MNESKPKISLIAALIEKTRAIGKGPDLLVRISDDLKRFKALTTGHPIIMGRKTFESIGRLLPGRPNFIISRNPNYSIAGAVVCQTLEEAISKASEEEFKGQTRQKEIFLIGGGEIYKQGLPFTDKLYLTLVETDLEGDVFFPDYSEFKKVISKEDRIDEKTGLKYSWVNLEK
nr:Dihydrofolate reductase [uncultured bacterium]